MSSSKDEIASEFAVQRVNPLEDPDWELRISTLPGFSFFHGRSWLEVLRETYGFSPAYFIASGSEAVPVVLPMMEVDSWLTGRRGIGLPFTDECSPLGRDAGAMASLYKCAISFARQRRWKYLEIRGGRQLLGDLPVSTAFFGHSLDLRSDESQLFARTDPAVRRAIRKAGQSDLTVTFSRDLTAMRTFYGLMCQTRRRHGLPAQPFGFFANIQRLVLARNQGQIVLARHGDIPVAGAVFFTCGKSAIYKFGASDERLQHLRANNLVMWEAIKWLSKQGFASLDFGRTSLANAGLRNFKLSWGAMERTIEYVRLDLRTGSCVTVRDEAAGWYNRIFRILPVSVSRLAGAVLYKHAA